MFSFDEDSATREELAKQADRADLVVGLGSAFIAIIVLLMMWMVKHLLH